MPAFVFLAITASSFDLPEPMNVAELFADANLFVPPIGWLSARLNPEAIGQQ
jgi:hypothetical protein